MDLRDEAAVPFDLVHRDGDLKYLDFRGRTMITIHGADLQGAVDLAILHQIPSCNGSISVLSSVHVFGKVEFHIAKYDSFGPSS